MNYYAGIGSRETPPLVCRAMTAIAEGFGKDWTLRSGGAAGADKAFEAGAFLKDIIRPDEATPEAIGLASKFHPAWWRLDQWGRKAHGRNAMIILGRDLKTPVSAVYCWTPFGHIVGGTATGIRIAKANGILVMNLATGDVSDNEKETMRIKGWPDVG